MTPAALEWLTRFRRYLSSERRLSAHTDQSYARDLAALVKFCDREGIAEWGALDSQHVRRFAAHSHKGGLAPRSIQRRLSAVRSFYAFLLREAAAETARSAATRGGSAGVRQRRSARITGNPAAEVRAPKAARRLPQTLDADQMARLLQIAAQGDPLGSRDRALMELLYSSGLRLAELVSLDVSSLDLKDGVVHVLGKGRKARIVPVGRLALRALREWLLERAVAADEQRVLIQPGERGARDSECTCTRICSATPLPRTCSNRAASCAACRNCWVTRISRPRRSIPTLTSST